MSAEQQVQEKIQRVLQAAAEPSYISEIARKLDDAFPEQTWNVSDVVQAVSVLEDNGRVETFDVGYDGTDGQVEGSPHNVLDPQLDGSTTEWKTYTIVHWEDGNIENIQDDEILDFVEPAVTVEQKASVIRELSGIGNVMSEWAELIMQDEMVRQFRNYDVVNVPQYNDPGLDFYVEDDEQRKYGLAIEVSTRYENPVDRPYLNSKQDKALERDADLLVLAPEFTAELLDEYENVDDERWHSQTEGDEVTHLHTVPNDRPGVYRPFVANPVDFTDGGSDGFPVIVPDDQRLRDKLRDTGHVGDSYPIVDDDGEAFMDLLDGVSRNYNAVRESVYRNQLREGMEPLLHEFSKPYQIEQWLIDTYWDQGLTTNEVGSLAGVSGRTIRRWLSDQHWDIVTRGTGTNLTDDTLEIWKRMYRGDSPFPREMTGYEIQALYNQHPFFTLDDWREWYQDTTEAERAEIMAQRPGPEDSVTYTILLGSDERLFPSYDFIIERLRSEGIEIREGFFGETGVVYPTATALEYMINRSENRADLDDEPDQRDVTTMRSSLEVDLAEYLSQEQIPFAHEPFAIPSPFAGIEDVSSAQELIEQSGDDEVRNTWRRIHNKHELGQLEDMPPQETLELVNTEFIVPDFTTYPGTAMQQRDENWVGWQDYANIIEVSGAYGTPPPTDFQSWYRFNSVASKELVFKLLGVWDKVLFVLVDDENIPQQVRNDSHYVIINPSQLDSGMDRIGADLVR